MTHLGNEKLPGIVIDDACFHGVLCVLYQFINYNGPGSTGNKIKKYTGVVDYAYGDTKWSSFHSPEKHLRTSSTPGTVYYNTVWFETENDELAYALIDEKCNKNTKAWDSEKHRIHRERQVQKKKYGWNDISKVIPDTSYGKYILCWYKAGYYNIVRLNEDGNIPSKYISDIAFWCFIPDPPC